MNEISADELDQMLVLDGYLGTSAIK